MIFPSHHDVNTISLFEISITNINDYFQLKEYITNRLYIDDFIIYELIERIGMNVDKIKIEYPYVDFDYTSTYSSYYSKKHLKLPKETIRLSFFKKNEFKGYLTLRPSYIDGKYGTKRGKAYLSPDIFQSSANSFLMLADVEANILGEVNKTRAFPWMSQETDVSVCAHITCWNVLRYFSLKYNNYAHRTINDVVNLTPEYIGRKAPVKSINYMQMSQILSNADLYPLILSKNIIRRAKPDENEQDFDNAYINEHNNFMRQVYSYVESGIPVIIGLNKGFGIGHAITIVGHGAVNYDKLNKLDKGTVYSADLIDSFIVINDNCLPYDQISNVLSENESRHELRPYTTHDITFAIVPLYEKMYISVDTIMARHQQLVQFADVQIPDDAVVRTFLTSSRSLKREIRKLANIDDNLRAAIVRTPLPKFVWIIEISTKAEYENKLTSQMFIIDSTCDTLTQNPWLIVQAHNKIYIKQREVEQDENSSFYEGDYAVIEITENIKPYSCYKNNLK